MGKYNASVIALKRFVPYNINTSKNNSANNINISTIQHLNKVKYNPDKGYKPQPCLQLLSIALVYKCEICFTFVKWIKPTPEYFN